MTTLSVRVLAGLLLCAAMLCHFCACAFLEDEEDNFSLSTSEGKKAEPMTPETPPPGEADYRIAIYAAADLETPEAELLFLESAFGSTIKLRRTVLLDSSEIRQVEPLVRIGEEGFYNLRLKFTPEGCRQWRALLENYDGKNLAFVVDGVFYRLFIPRRFYAEDADSILVDGPFDEVISRKIMNHSSINFQELQARKSSRKTP